MKLSKEKTTKNERDSHPLLVTMSTSFNRISWRKLFSSLVNQYTKRKVYDICLL